MQDGLMQALERLLGHALPPPPLRTITLEEPMLTRWLVTDTSAPKCVPLGAVELPHEPDESEVEDALERAGLIPVDRVHGQRAEVDRIEGIPDAFDVTLPGGRTLLVEKE